MARSGFWHGMAEALLLPLAFTALGLAWYGPLERAASAPASYPDLVRDPDREEDAGRGQDADGMRAAPETWLVDGFNVVQVALLGGRDRSEWWRAPQRAELLARAADFADTRSRPSSIRNVWPGSVVPQPSGGGSQPFPRSTPSAPKSSPSNRVRYPGSSRVMAPMTSRSASSSELPAGSPRT